MLIAIVNQSTLVSDQDASTMTQAIAAQVRLDVAPLWDRAPAAVIFYTKPEDVPVAAHGIAVVDTIKDQPRGVLGYHTEDPGVQELGDFFSDPTVCVDVDAVSDGPARTPASRQDESPTPAVGQDILLKKCAQKAVAPCVKSVVVNGNGGDDGDPAGERVDHPDRRATEGDDQEVFAEEGRSRIRADYQRDQSHPGERGLHRRSCLDSSSAASRLPSCRRRPRSW